MNKKLDFTNVHEKLWELETDYNLLHREIQGVKAWHLARQKIYNQVVQKTGLSADAQPGLKNSYLGNLKFLPNYLLNSIKKNPLTEDYSKDIVLLNHERRRLVNGKYIDINSNFLTEALNDDSYEVLEEPYLGKHRGKRNDNKRYLDYLLLSREINSILTTVTFDDEESKLLNNLEREIKNFFNIQINLKEIISKYIKKFKHEYGFYDKYLKKRSPKTSFLVSLSGKYSFVAAAKDNDIKVIEIQHGVISPYHIVYGFPNCDEELEYFPNLFLSFGDYWKDTAELPIKKEKIISFGYPYLEKMKKKLGSIEKKQGKIVFLSQGTVGKNLSRLAYQTAKRLKKFQIVYKLHPGEYSIWKKKYKKLKKAKRLENFKIVDNDRRNLYSYLAECEYQVGVSSTAIFEGLAFNCKTLLVDLPGIENMKGLIKRNIAEKVTNAYELEEKTCKLDNPSYKPGYFFKGLE